VDTDKPASVASDELPAESVESLPELLTVNDVAQLLRCKPSSVYNLTRKRARRYEHQIPVLRLPCGLRFFQSSIMQWLTSIETRGAA